MEIFEKYKNGEIVLLLLLSVLLLPLYYLIYTFLKFIKYFSKTCHPKICNAINLCYYIGRDQ